MKILVIDRDELSTKLISTYLVASGYDITLKSDKREACQLHEKQGFEMILLDPAPIKSAGDIVRELWRARPGKHPYILLMGQKLELKPSLQAGANDILLKPLDKAALGEKIGNAARLQGLRNTLAASGDTKSEGGAIAKSAFEQLFLTALDRANRSGDSSFILYISIDNMAELGKKASGLRDDVMRFLVRCRRQSDIISRISDHEFCLLLERPRRESEPFDAASRFTEELTRFAEEADQAPKFSLSLIELPFGAERDGYQIS